MIMEDTIINKVNESALITLNLEEFYPKEEIALFDIKDFLFMGLILKEKDFREALKNLDLEKYKDKPVAVTCSADAVIPMWAYMLIGTYLQPIAQEILFGTKEDVARQLLLKRIS